MFSANMEMIVDVIGLVVEVSEAYMVQLPNKTGPTFTRHVVLRDLRYECSVFLLYFTVF